MKKSRFSEEQIIRVLKESEAGTKTAELSLDKAILQDINAKKWTGPR